MREFAKFGTGFWTSSTIQALSDTGKLLAAYLITSPHSNQVGVFRMPIGYVQGDFGERNWPVERVAEAFAELSAKGFATRCDATGWVVIHKALKHNAPENPNQVKHVRGLLEQVPLDATIRAVIAQCLSATWPTVPPDILESLRKPSSNPSATVAEQREREREKKEKVPRSAGVATRPPAASNDDEPRTRSTWNAYAEAYEKRYSTPPVRNKSVNAKLALYVARIPAEEAPQVAAFYVTSNRPLYAAAKHCVDLLLRDAEALRTEWATQGNATPTAIEWWTTPQGIKAKAAELKIKGTDIEWLKCAIAAEVGGDSWPWIDPRNGTQERFIEEYRDELRPKAA